ncbi:MAG: hypothetical protein AB7U82_27625 [Blastocatellales bacterium]
MPAPVNTSKNNKGAEAPIPRGTVFVRSTLPPNSDGGNTVALWEQHPKHPGGGAFIAGPKPVEVALTPQVRLLIRDGVLEEIAAPDAAPAKPDGKEK